MSSQADASAGTTDPLRISFEVHCPARRAFEVWTRRIATWWPVSHSVSGEQGLQVVLEPRVGGRIFERTPTGQEHEWGEITLWEPPREFAYLWHLRQDRADASEVHIQFQSLDADSTRVEIEHRGWERLGARGPELRNRNQAGWSGLVPRYIEAIQKEQL
jgi:activator of Hsp90 ATPase-like protein